MEKHIEKIVIGLAFVALAALVIANVRGSASAVVNLPAEDYAASPTVGPLYLLGNMPYAYQPWVGNAIPSATSGQGSQSADLTQAPLMMGCASNMCG